jgi:hypothetical protein
MEFIDILLAEHIGQIFIFLLFLAELKMVAAQKHF